MESKDFAACVCSCLLTVELKVNVSFVVRLRDRLDRFKDAASWWESQRTLSSHCPRALTCLLLHPPPHITPPLLTGFTLLTLHISRPTYWLCLKFFLIIKDRQYVAVITRQVTNICSVVTFVVLKRWSRGQTGISNTMNRIWHYL